jgi:hypothetical protein
MADHSLSDKELMLMHNISNEELMMVQAMTHSIMNVFVSSAMFGKTGKVSAMMKHVSTIAKKGLEKGKKLAQKGASHAAAVAGAALEAGVEAHKRIILEKQKKAAAKMANATKAAEEHTAKTAEANKALDKKMKVKKAQEAEQAWKDAKRAAEEPSEDEPEADV